VLRTAQITQNRNRVVAIATLPQNLPLQMINGSENGGAENRESK